LVFADDAGGFLVQPFPAGVMANRALRVNRIACRRSLRDRNRGGAIFGPFRFPVTEAKKFQ